jgi:hypothetical protein
LIGGSIKEKEDASDAYHTALSQNEPASLLEQHTGVFSTSLGNVLAGERVRVEIGYVMELRLGAVITDPAEFPNADELLASKDLNEDIVIGTDFKVSRGEALTEEVINFDDWARLMSAYTLSVSWACPRALRILQISLVLTSSMPRKNSYLPSARVNPSQLFTSWHKIESG